MRMYQPSEVQTVYYLRKNTALSLHTAYVMVAQMYSYTSGKLPASVLRYRTFQLFAIAKICSLEGRTERWRVKRDPR